MTGRLLLGGPAGKHTHAIFTLDRGSLLFDDSRQPTGTLTAGQHGYAALARTPFYLEAGGQVSDSGRIFTEGLPVELTANPEIRRAHLGL